MSFAERSPSATRGLFAEVVRLQQADRRGALAIPLWSSGSVPMRSQSRLLLRDDGTAAGTIGGGLLEAQVLAAAREVISGDEARVLEFDLAGDEAARSGMICGGQCAVLVAPIAPERDRDVFAAAAQAEADGQRAALITVLPGAGPAPVLALSSEGRLIGSSGDPAVDGALRHAARECLEQEEPRLIEEPVRAHIDIVAPRPVVFVFGGGHIGAVLAHLAALVGFRVVVTDDREEFANRDRFPHADEVLAVPVPEFFARHPIGEHAYLVAVTRGHANDEEVLVFALRTPARYIGMIGSKRKVAAIFARLREQGFTDADLARVHAPIGLAIGADTVEEIAVSIIAELIEVRRNPSQ
jgi:xanthine dehydrogenase accessory factor